MNRRERLMATLRGEPADRPPVSFYEITGLEDTSAGDPFNIYTHPSWSPLIKLAGEKTDRIARCKISFSNGPRDPWDEFSEVRTWREDGKRFTRRTVKVGQRELTATSRRDPDVNTVWEVEPLLKNPDDLKALLELPAAEFGGEPDIAPYLETEELVGDSGIVMVDTPDPLCQAAALFEMGEFTIVAMTEQKLFHQLLERFAALLHPKTEAIARALPGRLWRIFGPEYASPPFLPPRLFREYVVRYDTPMVDAIQQEGGFARIHSHGNLRDILDDIIATGCIGLDPIEPPPQGDVELSYVRKKYGEQLVLFGNLEASDIVGLPTPDFELKVRTAIREGTAGTGRGFVLMPSGAPYGRELPPLAMANYEKMIDVIEEFS